MRLASLVVMVLAVVATAGPKKRATVKPAPSKSPVVAAAEAPPLPSYVTLQAATTSDEQLNGLLPAATAQLRNELSRYAVDVAPDGATDAETAQAIKDKRAEGVRLQVVLSNRGEGLRVALLVTKWPSGGLRGSWDTTASGPAASELLEAALPRSVEDVALDFGWQRRP